MDIYNFIIKKEKEIIKGFYRKGSSNMPKKTILDPYALKLGNLQRYLYEDIMGRTSPSQLNFLDIFLQIFL